MNDIKFQVSEWLLKHGEETLSNLQKRINPNYKLLPDFAYEMFLDNYSDEAFKILKNDAALSLNINMEEMSLFFTKQWVIMLLGKDVLCPPKT